MEQIKLKLLIENELYPLVLANSQDELAKITINAIRNAINEFIKKYKEELTDNDIDFLTEYIWTVINRKQNQIKEDKEKE